MRTEGGEAVGNRKKIQAIDRRETPLTPERIAVFLADLEKHGIAVQAARAASPHSKDPAQKGAVSTFYALKRRDPHFAAQWAEALEVADGALLAEAHRRAVDGTSKALFFKGERIYDLDPETGKKIPVSEKEYSDRLLELMLKARFPRLFVERHAVEHFDAPGGWQITVSDLNCLSDSQTEQLQEIMASVMASRGEIEADPALEYQPAEVIDVTPEAENAGDFDVVAAKQAIPY